MNFKIVHELPGRIRVICPAYSFDAYGAAAIEHALEQDDSVNSCQVNHANWSIKIHFERTARQSIIQQLKNLELNQRIIDDCPNLRQENKLITQNLFRQISRLTLTKILQRKFFPPLLAWPVTLYNALSYLRPAWQSIKERRLSVALLDGTAIAVSLLTKQRTQASNIMYLLNISECLEEYTLTKSKMAVANSLAFNVDKVWLVRSASENTDNLRRVSLTSIQKGDIIRVEAGSFIPLDGDVLDGEAMVNQASITGEFEPVFKNTGKTVISGTSLTEGTLDIKVHSTFTESRIKQIMNLLQVTEQNKANVEVQAVKLAERLVPLSFGLFGLLLLTKRSLSRASAVLMVDYSCALRLSLPVAVLTAMLQASRQKVAVRSGLALEEMALADTIVFDKTGTVTTSRPEVVKVIAVNGFERTEILKTMACIEEHFPHSLASAIVRYAKQQHITHSDERHTKVNYIIAHGVSTIYQGREALVGSHHFLFEDSGVELTKEIRELIEREAEGYSVIYLSIDRRLAGFICLDEPPRQEVKQVLSDLRSLGFKQIILLTGDGKHAASRVSRECGFDHYYYEMLPQQKVEIIEQLQRQGHRVVMVGDGINDSPALKKANVSIAMQDSSDIARDVADISLLADQLSLIPRLRQLSTRLQARLNLTNHFILRFNSLLLLLATFEIIPAQVAALLHNSSTLAITAHNMRPLAIDRKNNKKEVTI